MYNISSQSSAILLNVDAIGSTDVHVHVHVCIFKPQLFLKLSLTLFSYVCAFSLLIVLPGWTSPFTSNLKFIINETVKKCHRNVGIFLLQYMYYKSCCCTVTSVYLVFVPNQKYYFYMIQYCG